MVKGGNGVMMDKDEKVMSSYEVGALLPMYETVSDC